MISKSKWLLPIETATLFKTVVLFQEKLPFQAHNLGHITVCTSVSFIFTVFLLWNLSLHFNWVKSEDFDHSAERKKGNNL